MDDRTEAAISFMVIWLVLFTAMLEPRISLGLAIIGLVGLATCKVVHPHMHRRPL